MRYAGSRTHIQSELKRNHDVQVEGCVSKPFVWRDAGSFEKSVVRFSIVVRRRKRIRDKSKRFSMFQSGLKRNGDVQEQRRVARPFVWSGFVHFKEQTSWIFRSAPKCIPPRSTALKMHRFPPPTVFTGEETGLAGIFDYRFTAARRHGLTLGRDR